MPLSAVKRQLSAFFDRICDIPDANVNTVYNQACLNLSRTLRDVLVENGFDPAAPRAEPDSFKYSLYMQAVGIISHYRGGDMDFSSIRDMHKSITVADMITTMLKDRNHPSHARYAAFAIGCTGLIPDKEYSEEEMLAARHALVHGKPAHDTSSQPAP